MSIKGIFKNLNQVSDFGNQEQTQPKTATPTFVPTTETDATQKRLDQQNYGDYRRNQIQTQWAEQQFNGNQSSQTQTSKVKVTQTEFPKVPEAKYTPADIKRLFGDNSSYGEVDYWIDVISFREGKISDAADVGDGAGLSVGIFQWTQKSGRLGELMQKYKDVAANDGKLEEFYKVFGGKEKAENLRTVF